MANSALRIAVMPGDGIGIEIMEPCLEILRQVQARVGGFSLDFEELPAGAGHYRETGTALPEDSLKRAGEADAILLGAMGLPDVRYPDGRAPWAGGGARQSWTGAAVIDAAGARTVAGDGGEPGGARETAAGAAGQSVSSMVVRCMWRGWSSP